MRIRPAERSGRPTPTRRTAAAEGVLDVAEQLAQTRGFNGFSYADVAAKLSEILELQPPEGLAAKVRGLKTLKSIVDSRPKVVRSGACQEVVLQGADVDLGRLPVQTCWPGDAGCLGI